MSRFCLDTNILIQAKNGPYAFDIAPRFWGWLNDQFESGVIYSSIFVFEELARYDDELARWVQSRKDFFIEPDEGVQLRFTEIVNEVQQNNRSQLHADKFLSGADPWVIAHALTSGDVIVTHEKRVGDIAKPVKIPNVCDRFGSIRCIDTYQMMRELRAVL